MDEQLISKKELLECTGISYGQLYRWKRKGLIPEEWFIKRSAYTGQETFFPKDKMLERINKIMAMKDEMPLDYLAEMFSPHMERIHLTEKQLVEKNIVTQTTLDAYRKLRETCDSYSYDKIIAVVVLEELLQSNLATVEEGHMVLNSMEENYKFLMDKPCEVLLIRKFGVAICLLSAMPNQIYIENTAKLLARISITDIIEKLKIKLGGEYNGK